jgi:hypothetical protein
VESFIEELHRTLNPLIQKAGGPGVRMIGIGDGRT